MTLFEQPMHRDANIAVYIEIDDRNRPNQPAGYRARRVLVANASPYPYMVYVETADGSLGVNIRRARNERLLRCSRPVSE